MKKESGKITISQVTCSGRDGHIFIQICGEGHRHIVDVKVPLKEFAEAITGLGYIDCETIVYSEPKEKVQDSE